MTTATGVVLVGAGLSETVGRIVPLLARRHRPASHATVLGLLLAGTVVQALLFTSWPVAATTLAGLLRGSAPAVAASVGGTVTWSAGAAAPLLFCAVLAFPLLGPALHVVVLTVAGLDLTGRVAAATGLAWWPAAACVAVSAVVLALLLEGIRRVVGAVGGTP